MNMSIADYTGMHDLIRYRLDNIQWAAAIMALVTDLLLLVCDWLMIPRPRDYLKSLREIK